jgi:hypothetical protein
VKLVYLAQSRRDVAWWRRYYWHTFPEGRLSANRHYLNTVALLVENPFLGRPVEGFDLRQLPSPNTPFQLIYRVRKQTLEIVRIWDMRQKSSHGFQED